MANWSYLTGAGMVGVCSEKDAGLEPSRDGGAGESCWAAHLDVIRNVEELQANRAQRLG